MNLFRAAATAPTAAPASVGSPPTAVAAETPPRPDRNIVGWSYLVVVIGGIAAWRLNHWLRPDPPSVLEGLGVLVLLYVMAQVIERLLEPAVRLTVPATKTLARDEAVADAVNNSTDIAKAQTAANAQRDVDAERATVAVAVWAAASVLGMLLSAMTGAYLLTALGVNGLEDKPAVDVVVTGMAIGAGSKPIHDLITRIDAAKNATKDPPETK